jgi:hypothetical protein
MLCVRPRPQFCRNWEEKSKSVPTPAGISWRVFEIHIERGGIHGRDLEDWLRGRMLTFQKSSKARKKKEQKSEVRRGDDVEIREMGAGYEVAWNWRESCEESCWKLS